jgi:hypothetical protein
MYHLDQKWPSCLVGASMIGEYDDNDSWAGNKPFQLAE